MKEFFYLMTHSAHFIYGYMALGIEKRTTEMVGGNSLPPHGLLIPIGSKASFIYIPQTGLYIPRLLLHQSWNTGWNEK